jgi:hypothetical protein
MARQQRTPEIVRIPDNRDTVMQKVYLREYAERHFPFVDLIRLDRNETIVDDLYVEATNRRFLDPVRIHALVLHKPSKKLLGKYGMDQSRDVMFHFTTLDLSELGFLENRDDFLIGDLVDWGGDIYEIKDQIKDEESYWVNTNIPFYLAIGADYYREGI